MRFGEKIREVRKQKRMSRKSYAEYLGIAERTLKSWECETRNPLKNIPTEIIQIELERRR